MDDKSTIVIGSSFPHFSDVQGDVRLALDDVGQVLPGWPGYRNRPGRSGLDPLDFQFELAHMEGRIIRMLIDRDWPTSHPIYKGIYIFTGIYLTMYNLFVFGSYLASAILVGKALYAAFGVFFPIGAIVFMAFLFVMFRELDRVSERERE